MTVKRAQKKAIKKRLTPKQERFVENILSNGGNAAKAARDAGYSEKRARVTGHELTVTNRNIQERIKARMEDAKVQTNEVVGTLVSQMRGDVGDIIPDHPLVKKAKAVGMSHLIKKVVTKKYWDKHLETEVEETTFELHSSQAAAKQLCAVFGLNKEDAKNPYDAARDAFAVLRDEFKDVPTEVIAERVAQRFGVESAKLISEAIN